MGVERYEAEVVSRTCLGKWRAFSDLHGLPFELRRADEAERRMSADRIAEAVEVSADGGCCLGAVSDSSASDGLRLQGLVDGERKSQDFGSVAKLQRLAKDCS